MRLSSEGRGSRPTCTSTCAPKIRLEADESARVVQSQAGIRRPGRPGANSLDISNCTAAMGFASTPTTCASTAGISRAGHTTRRTAVPWSRGGGDLAAGCRCRRSSRGTHKRVSAAQYASHPRLTEVQAACLAFLRPGFFPQALFVEQLKSDITSISSFLLLAILAASARHVPNLVRRFGTADAASKFYSDHVRKRMVDEMLKVSLQGCQAFFLLSVNEWGGYSGEESAVSSF